MVGAVLAEVLLGFRGPLGVLGQAALQFLPPALVAALLDGPLQFAHLAFVGVRHRHILNLKLAAKLETGRMARVLIATDAWHPQVSGVVRTLDTTARVLRDWGHAVEIVEPTPYWSVPFPFYPDVPMCLPRAGADLRAHREVPPGPRPHFHGGGNRPRGSPLLPQNGLAVHHIVPHALPRVSAAAGVVSPSRSRTAF